MEVGFGTDGARGRYPDRLNEETAYRIAVGAAQAIGMRHSVFVQDTRDFNPALVAAAIEGLASQGVTVYDAGILPTPAAAILAGKLTRTLGEPVNGFSFSASHNPADQAGIKVFNVGGYKLDDEETGHVQMAANSVGIYTPVSNRYRPSEGNRDRLRSMYIAHLLDTVEPGLRNDRFLSGKKIVVDAANGAGYWSSPYVLSVLGADVRPIFVDPTAEINAGCGATDTEAMIAEVERVGADIGIAHDGDNDRNKAHERKTGRELDGDDALAVALRAMMFRKERPKGVVSTGYSNLGFEGFLQINGIPYVVAENGDRYVLQEMLAHGYPLGGENSGHTLYAQVAERTNTVLTGDGTVTALQLLQASALMGKPLGEISDWPKLPHIQEEVHMPEGVNAKEVMKRPDVASDIEAAKADFAGQGDILTRASGTEPLARILVRGHDQATTEVMAGRLVTIIRQAAGV